MSFRRLPTNQSSTFPVNSETHWANLSLVRFMLSFAVLLGHIDISLPGRSKWEFGVGGVPAVAGFFLISGFSIAHSISAKRTHFIKRRFLRIVPLSTAASIFGYIAVTMARVWNGSIPLFVEPSAISVLGCLFFLNGIIVRTPYILLPIWSLNCEVVYYLLAQFFKDCSDWFLMLLISISVFLFVMYAASLEIWFGLYGVPAATMLWIWLTGFLLYRHQIGTEMLVVGVIAGITAIYLFEHAPLSSILVGFALPFVMVARFNAITMPPKFTRIANYLGELSYPLYLFHFPVINITRYFIPSDHTLNGLVVDIAGPLILSVAAYHVVDAPIRKRRFHRQPL